MMSWNYRIVEHKSKTIHKIEKINRNNDDEAELLEEDFYYYQIHEVYYNNENEIEKITLDAMYPYGETVEELKKDIEMMIEAFNKPSLNMEEINKHFEKLKLRKEKG